MFSIRKGTASSLSSQHGLEVLKWLSQTKKKTKKRKKERKKKKKKRRCRDYDPAIEMIKGVGEKKKKRKKKKNVRICTQVVGLG